MKKVWEILENHVLLAPPAIFAQLTELIAQCMASILNKLLLSDELSLTHIISEFINDKLLTTVEDDTATEELRIRCLIIVLWQLKALLVRSHAASTSISIRLFKLLLQADSHPELAFLCAQSCELLLSDNVLILNRRSHAIVSPGQLYKQRFFSFMYPNFMSMINSLPTNRLIESNTLNVSNDDGAKVNMHRNAIQSALLATIQYIPSEVVSPHLSSIIPMLVSSLTSDNHSLQLRALLLWTSWLSGSSSTNGNTEFEEIIISSQILDVLHPHLSTLIPVLLQLCSSKSLLRQEDMTSSTKRTNTPLASSSTVRLSALQCLFALATLDFSYLSPYKVQVLHALLDPLDDPKRDVRRAAARCRNKWFTLDIVEK
jgi:hypothetical protein